MSVTPSSATVGVFRDRATAEQALDALYNAGFTHEQVRYSVPEASGGFFDDLKSLFTGQNASGSVANDLTDLGLSDEEANYYADEHSKGNIILAVKAPGRSAEVQTILQQYGSLNTQPYADSPQETTYPSDTASEPITTNDDITEPAPAIAHNTELDTSYQSNAPTVPPEHEPDQQGLQPMTTDYNAEALHADQPLTTNGSVEQYDAQSVTTQDTPPITHDNVPESQTEQTYDSQEAYPVVTDGSLPEEVSSTTSTHDDEPTPTLSDTEQQPQSYASDAQPATTEDTAEQRATSDVQIESQTASDTTPEEPQVAHDSYTAESEAAYIPDIQTAQPVATTADYTAESNDTQLSDAQIAESKVPTEPLTNSTTTNDEPVTTATTEQQSVTGTTDNADELQSLQAQIASLQQQLQDAKAQLQAAKEREEQVRTAREREQQLQTLRQQLQALQAELAATHSELQDTQSRLGQDS